MDVAATFQDSAANERILDRQIKKSTAFARVTALAALRPVHEAFNWLHQNPLKIRDWQLEVVQIPAPPFGESARALWIADRFRYAGLSSVHTDEIGNVFATWPAQNLPRESTGPVVIISAHLDTVFPASTPLTPTVSEDGETIAAPGICDNAAGIVGMLAIAHAIVAAQIPVPVPILFLANVGEEGEGDLRGVRHLYHHNTLASRIAAHIILDGAGTEQAVTQALGSRRLSITIKGPGGHSFSDYGTPNPILALSSALNLLSRVPLPVEPRSTLNIGTIEGGTSVNSIPEFARASVDLRSTSPQQLVRMEVEVNRAVEEAIAEVNLQQTTRPNYNPDRDLLSFSIDKIGDRPAARLPAESPLLETLRAVDRHLSLRTEQRLGSTDANLPLSIGVPAISLGAGGEGGGAHTRHEWYNAKGRELALRRILLLALAMTDWAAIQ
jgi:acetylornithine deacetylase/succinyl-diaminopimelate desuccinylase-like protein